MTITAEALRVARSDERRIRLADARKLECTLIPDDRHNAQLIEIINQLRTAPFPKDVGQRRRKVERTVPAFPVRFYARSAGGFVNEHGRVIKRKVNESAQVFVFEGDVTITRERHGSGWYFSLSEGRRSVSIGMKETRDERTFWLMRSGGFAAPSNRTARRGRFAGRGPSGMSE